MTLFYDRYKAVNSINELIELCHAANKKWWLDPATGKPITRNKGELIALMHSELSEALEGARKNLMDDKLPNRKMEVVEIIDLLIRAFDYLGGMGYVEAGEVFVEKTDYNAQRADHKPENRLKEGGKKF